MAVGLLRNAAHNQQWFTTDSVTQFERTWARSPGRSSFAFICIAGVGHLIHFNMSFPGLSFF